MSNNLLILICEAFGIYLLVLGAHALRNRYTLAPFYAILGGITAVMSWVTDAGVYVDIGGITFMVGSTVFYTSLLLGVFVVYVFDGPQATRIAILTVAGVSALVPLIAAALHFQMKLSSAPPLSYVPLPSFRINVASVVATVLDLVFLAMAWELLGSPLLRAGLSLRAFLTLLGVMWLDVLLFATGAFFGTPAYLSIMEGTLYSRLIIAVFASPFLYLYLHWQSRHKGCSMERRPILAILREVASVREELSLARQEIEHRKEAEAALQHSRRRYRQLARYIDRVLESERSRLADVLHDQIGQMLTALNIDLDALGRASEADSGALQKMQQLLHQGIFQIHTLCRRLRPGSLDDLGMAEALRGLADDWSAESGIPVRLTISSTLDMDVEKRTVLFRVIQDALEYVSEQTQSRSVSISVKRGLGRVCFFIQVSDGTHPIGQDLYDESFLLLRIRERMSASGGELKTDALPAGGVVMEGVLPL